VTQYVCSSISGEPAMVFILPFLLPLFIIVAFIRGMSEIFGWKQLPGRLKTRRGS